MSLPPNRASSPRREGRGALTVWPAAALPLLLVAGLAASGAAAADRVPDWELSVGGEPLDCSLTERETEPEARQAAAACGVPVEVLEARSEYAQVFVNEDGLMTFESAAVPLRVNRDGVWWDIDASLQPAAGGGYVPVATTSDIWFSGGGSGPLVRWVDGDEIFELFWPGPLPVPSLDGEVAIYPEVRGGVDLHAVATRDGFSHVLVVHTLQAAAALLADPPAWQVGGTVSAVLDDTGLVLIEGAAGQVVAVSPGAFQWDSTRQSPDTELLRAMGEPVVPAEASTSIRPGPLANVTRAEVAVDDGAFVVEPAEAMFDHPDVVWPVFVDPDFKPYNTKFAYANSINSNWDVGGLAWVGRNPFDGTLYRSFFDLPTTSGTATIKGKQIISAKVTARLQHSWSCSPTWAWLYRTGAITATPRMSWSTRPLPTANAATAAQGNANKAGGCGSIQPDMTMEFSSSALKSDIQHAADSNWNLYTVGLCACNKDGQYESNQDRWKKFYQDRVRFVIVYDSVPDTPTNVKVSTDCVPSCTSPATVRATRPELQARVRNEHGGSLTVSFQLRDYATNTIITTGTVENVPNNSDAKWKTPTLTNGTEYRFRVRATNSNGVTGSWSSYFRFTVDTSGPGVPSAVGVSSTGVCWPEASCDSPAMLRSARPMFKGTPQHPFGDRTDVVFQVHYPTHTEVYASGTVSDAPVGVAQTWQPSGDLPEGQWRLRVRSVNDDYARNGSWSGWFHFTVDTVAPQTPTVTSLDYAHKDTSTWNGGVGVPGQFDFGPDGSDDVIRYEWRWNGGGLINGVDVPAGQPTSQLLTPPGDLLQVLEVRSIDHAGWVSGWRPYEFWVRPQPVDSAYWQFDEVGGSVAFATVGGPSYAGTLSTGAGFVPSQISDFFPEASGNAVSLDGAGGHVQMPTVVQTDHVAGFTLSAWVKATSLSGTHTVVAQNGADAYMARIVYLQSANGGLGGWCLQVSESDSLAAAVTQVCSPDDQVKVGEWQYLAAVFDRPAGVLRLYVDAGFNNVEWPPGWEGQVTAPTAWTAAGDFLVGTSASGDFWHGLVDEVRAYQRVVPEAEMVDYFLSCRYGSCEPMP